MTRQRPALNAHPFVSAPFILSCALLLVATGVSQEQKSPLATKRALPVEQSSADGRQTFESRCSGCHGLDGRGGERAPDVVTNAKTRRRSDEELFRIIDGGLPGQGMPSFGSMGSENVKRVVSYLRLLQGKIAESLPGNPQKGHELFYGKARCSECHMAAGAGGFIATDLTTFGGTRSAAEIRAAIAQPGTGNRQGGKMKVKARDGQEYSGVVRNEDNFSVQLQSLDGRFQLFLKSELATFARQPDSLMPGNYGSTLTATELNDIVSFLMSTARDPKAEETHSERPDNEEEFQ
jgi:cytochrome c oxidase cbb3-type subunit III